MGGSNTFRKKFIDFVAVFLNSFTVAFLFLAFFC